MDNVYALLLIIAMGVLGTCLFVCLFRTFRGPTPADRVIAVNMIGTMVVTLICILTLRLGEGYLTDVAMIYTLLSFLAVVMLTKLLIGAWRSRHQRAKDAEETAKEENRDA